VELGVVARPARLSAGLDAGDTNALPDRDVDRDAQLGVVDDEEAGPLGDVGGDRSMNREAIDDPGATETSSRNSASSYSVSWARRMSAKCRVARGFS
jgi:hypothetical protein